MPGNFIIDLYLLMKTVLLLLLTTQIVSAQRILQPDTVDYSKMTDSAVVQHLIFRNTDPEKKGMDLPNFKALSLDNGLSKIVSEKRKRIIFYNFWFISCTPCVAEMPMLNELKKEYAARVDFVAITFDDTTWVKEFLTEHPFNFDQFYMPRDSIRALGITFGYPTTAIVVDGKVVHCEYGGVSQKSRFFDLYMQVQKAAYEGILNTYLE